MTVEYSLISQEAILAYSVQLNHYALTTHQILK